MAFPTKANMTALVCKGLIRPKDPYCVKLAAGSNNCVAMITPTSMPTIPQIMVAMAKFRTALLS